MERGLVGDGELVRPHCEAAPLLESGDAPLDGIALLVCLGVEAGRAASGAASTPTVADLVGGLRDDRTDAASPEVAADRAGGVGAIRKDDRRAVSWPAASAPRDPDSSHDRLERRRVTGLASGDREIFERNALARELPAFFTPDAYSRHLVQQAEVTA